MREVLRIRLHRGGLAESMATAEMIESSCDAIDAFLVRHGLLPRACGDDDLTMVQYIRSGADRRTGWDTHLVSVNGKAVAYLDGLPRELKR